MGLKVQMSIEKKIFPKFHHSNYDFSKRWYVYVDIPTHKGLHKKRIVRYGKLNALPTIEARILEANEIVQSLTLEYCNVEGLNKPKKATCPLIDVIHTKLKVRQRSEQTYLSKVKQLHQFLKGKPVSKMNKEDAINFMQFIFDKCSGTTYNNYRMIFNRIFSMAVKYQLLKENYFTKIDKVKARSKSKMFFSDVQKKYLKDRISKENVQLWLSVQLLYYCFIRPKEQRFLTIGDIDFDNAKICIRGEISKNGKTEWINIPKAFYPDLEHLKNYTPTNYIFTKNGYPGVTPTAVNYFNGQHRKFLQNTLFGKNYSLYSWKHTGAVAAIKSGVNVKELQLQLRHHSLDEVNEYLKNMGINDCKGIINLFPLI